MEGLKGEINKLMQQRSAIEAEIGERSQRLNAPGQPGMTGSLIDKEGFPRSDIDIHAVRTDRNAIIRLTNDHKQLSTQLEQLLHQLHALARETGATSMNGASPAKNGAAAAAPAAAAAAAAAPAAASASSSAPAAADGHEDKKPRIDQPPPAAAAAAAAPEAPAAAGSGVQGGPVGLRPFAVVDEVADASPAAAAGIQLGDQLCRFGAAVAGSGNELQQVAQELQQHEGQAVSVVFLRQGAPLLMELVPRKWEGRGLLGCHLRPL